MDAKGKGRAIDVDALDDDIADSYATTSSSDRPYLAGLNAAQREAVTWSRNGGLQILAGPGSGEDGSCLKLVHLGYHRDLPCTDGRSHFLRCAGKTRVLTCRVAHLVQQCRIPPQDLIVVTFTNKVRYAHGLVILTLYAADRIHVSGCE